MVVGLPRDLYLGKVSYPYIPTVDVSTLGKILTP